MVLECHLAQPPHGPSEDPAVSNTTLWLLPHMVILGYNKSSMAALTSLSSMQTHKV